MDERETKNKLQCIVDEGIVVNRRDMVRILRDLGHVRYCDLVEGATRREGEGIIMSVFANDKASTIIVNKRLYINVNSFDYLKLGGDDDGVTIDLIDEQRTVRLLPLTDGLQERQCMIAEATMIPSSGALERILGVEPGEGFEEDYDESDEL